VTVEVLPLLRFTRWTKKRCSVLESTLLIGEQGHAQQPVPLAGLHLLSIALCVVGAPVYELAGLALTVSCPLAQPRPFRSRPPGEQPGAACFLTRAVARPDGRSMSGAKAAMHVVAALLAARGRGSREGRIVCSMQSANRASQRESFRHAFTGRIPLTPVANHIGQEFGA
jgi:hypothetical protein